jgi:orotate phosphoribosyltransferase
VNDVLDHFREAGALLDGHFVLSSGLHSPQYLQCALAMKDPEDAARFGKAIAENFKGEEIDIVASPAIGGIIIGFAVAQSLHVPFIWTERENGVMTLRRGFSIGEGEKILVVEDVITTGGSTRECIKALEDSGAQVVGAASIVDRSDGKADVGVPRVSLVTLDVPTYSADQCPLCERGVTITKPGSRQ